MFWVYNRDDRTPAFPIYAEPDLARFVVSLDDKYTSGFLLLGTACRNLETVPVTVALEFGQLGRFRRNTGTIIGANISQLSAQLGQDWADRELAYLFRQLRSIDRLPHLSE